MPVEIKELIIRATIINGDDRNPASENVQSSSEEEIIAACVAQVLKILKRKQER